MDNTEEMDFLGRTQKELQDKDHIDELGKEYIQTSYTYFWLSDLKILNCSPVTSSGKT